MKPAEPVKIFAKCRRGSDQATKGQSCKSLDAIRISKEGSASVMFRCSKCSFVWVVPVGGAINI